MREYRSIQEETLEIRATGSLVVVRTTAGAAATVGAELDASGRREIAATVAGDDTVLVICHEPPTQAAVRVLAYVERVVASSNNEPYWPVCRPLVRDVTAAGQHVLVHAVPAAAAVIGAAIDSLQIDEVAGTVAGDDVLLVICSEPPTQAAAGVVAHVESLVASSTNEPYWPACRQLVRDVTTAGQHVLVHTLPAAAELVGAAMDIGAEEEIYATVGGDDILLLVCSGAPTEAARNASTGIFLLKSGA